ncbi:hypothetical protein [uncultured Campylobacter sp.]|uniref:hypothetical protein n=1 Tax=uncultured Campylobacter sp. TaxID=218934 RepID=UPI002632C197|nr:hypothetical protein [uncultured Campylobacter sp.]
MAGHLAFASCSALDFIRLGVNAEFAKDSDAVKFTEFDAKDKHTNKSAQKHKPNRANKFTKIKI